VPNEPHEEKKQKEAADKAVTPTPNKALRIQSSTSLSVSRGKDKKTGKKLVTEVKDILQFTIFGVAAKQEAVLEYIKGKGFTDQQEAE